MYLKREDMSKNEDEWKAKVDELKSKVSGSPDKERLKQAIIDAVKQVKEPFGVLFSGGVDSVIIALICKQLGLNFTCYTVGFKDSPDIFYAREIAKKYNLNYKEKIFDLHEIHEILKKTIKIFPKQEFSADYFVTIDVASVIVAAKSIAKENTFFSGLGAEEIFAGYARHGKVQNVNEECWRGLREMWKRDFHRDLTVGKALKIKFLTPFLDESVIIEAMKFGDKDKIGENNKLILRKIAEELGLDKKYAERKKQGAQYGSKFDNAILKLTKMNGFKYKQQYIESIR